MSLTPQIPIYETENFYIQASARPFVDRDEGGHIYLFPLIGVLGLPNR